jgi:hypothetical protein
MSGAPADLTRLEQWFLQKATPADHQVEQSHYDEIVHLTANGHRMESVNYLYARLNIIDSKASSILAVNTLALGITSLTVTSGDLNNLVTGVTLVMSLVSLIAILLSLAITRCDFDHITPTHTVDDYEAQFFSLTIARQRMLGSARILTAIALILYAVILIMKLLLSL